MEGLRELTAVVIHARLGEGDEDVPQPPVDGPGERRPGEAVETGVENGGFVGKDVEGYWSLVGVSVTGVGFATGEGEDGDWVCDSVGFVVGEGFHE